MANFCLGVMPPMVVFGRSLLKVHSHFVAKSAAAHGSIVAFDVGILLWLAWLYKLELDASLFRPLLQRIANVFRPIIAPTCLRFATPFDHLV